nr:protein LOL1-like [Nicotiana tomentosiformis]
MQSQLVCSGCRTILLYPRGATNVCCAVCNALTPVPPPGMEMAQLICGGCRTLLMHPRGATSVRCACCHTVNLVPGTFFFRIKESHSLLLKFSFSSWKPSSYFSLSIFSYLAFENIYCILTSICFTFFQ